MKKIFAVLSLFLASLVPLSFGQASLTQTTLAAALTKTNNVLTVASATGITANSTVLYILDGTSGGEFIEAVNAVSGTQISVTRAGRAKAHLSGALVLLGPANYFVNSDPNGACTSTDTVATPRLNTSNGREWICSTISNSWVPGFFNLSQPAGVTLAVASVAGATNVTGPLFHVTGTNAITAWGTSTSATGVGMGGSATSVIGAPFCVIPDAAYTTTATNNIAVATTGVLNKIQCWVFDQTNKKYVASY